MLFYNFVTGEYDDLPDGGPATDEAAKQYIDQLPAALNLYDVERQLGRSILEALKAVYLAQTTSPWSQP